MMRKTERGGKEKGNFVNGIAKIAEEKICLLAISLP